MVGKLVVIWFFFQDVFQGFQEFDQKEQVKKIDFFKQGEIWFIYIQIKLYFCGGYQVGYYVYQKQLMLVGGLGNVVFQCGVDGGCGGGDYIDQCLYDVYDLGWKQVEVYGIYDGYYGIVYKVLNGL